MRGGGSFLSMIFKITGDAIDVKVNEGLLAFFAEEDVVFAQLAAPLVHTAAALGQGDVVFLGHQESGVVAPSLDG